MLPAYPIRRIKLQSNEIENLQKVLGTEKSDEGSWYTGKENRLVAISTIGEKVSLKGCCAHYHDIDLINQFSETERNLLKRIDHPNVVKVVSIENLETILKPLATEYIKGQTLQELIESRELTHDQIKHIVKQLFQGVSAIHEAGIHHLDLFTINIMIDNNFNIKIIDFDRSEENSSRSAQLHDTSQLLHIILFIIFKDHKLHGFNPRYVNLKISELDKSENHQDLYQFLHYVNTKKVTATEALDHTFITGN